MMPFGGRPPAPAPLPSPLQAAMGEFLEAALPQVPALLRAALANILKGLSDAQIGTIIDAADDVLVKLKAARAQAAGPQLLP